MTTTKTKHCPEVSASGVACTRPKGHDGEHACGNDDGSIHRWGRGSGPTKPHAARQKDGRVRVEVYLSPEEAKALEALTAAAGSKRDAIGQALLACHKFARK